MARRVFNKRSLGWALGAIATVAVGSALAWMFVEARAIFTISSDEAMTNSAQVSAKASALQAFAAIAGLGATVMLLAVTAWYAVITRGILRSSGPIISAELKSGWVHINGVAVVTAPFDPTGKPFDPQFAVPVVVVHVRNSGNAALRI